MYLIILALLLRLRLSFLPLLKQPSMPLTHPFLMFGLGAEPVELCLLQRGPCFRAVRVSLKNRIPVCHNLPGYFVAALRSRGASFGGGELSQRRVKPTVGGLRNGNECPASGGLRHVSIRNVFDDLRR